MVRLRCCWALLAMTAIVPLGVGCGDDGGDARPSPQPTTTPVFASPAPTLPGALTPAGTPTMASPSVTVDLAVTAPALTIFGADFRDLLSDVPALALGDFNGDGIADTLVGARFGDGPDNAREDAGEAYVIFGSDRLPGTVDLAEGEQDLTIFGAKPGDNLGYEVAGGDVDGDGIDDILVAAPFSNGPANERTDPGEIYVVLGSPALGGTIDVAQNEQRLRIAAAEGFALLGDSMSVADVNDDGIGDIIGGAPFGGREAGAPVGGPRTQVGEIYVVFGSPTLEGTMKVARDEQDFTFAGVERSSELGDSVASGDVNGDGIADIIAAAEAADGPEGSRRNAGQVYVIFGTADLAGKASVADGIQALTILGADAQDTLGFTLAIGDVNGDGIDDILASARLADGIDNARNEAGEVYLIFGSPTLAGTVDIAAGQADVTIVAARPNLLLGSLASGDLNGDGIDDIVLGTRYAGRGTPASGEAYVLFGSSTLPETIDLAVDGPDIGIVGAQPDDGLGGAMKVGDVNGDGVNELIIVADQADGPDDARLNAGEIYVLPLPSSE